MLLKTRCGEKGVNLKILKYCVFNPDEFPHFSNTGTFSLVLSLVSKGGGSGSGILRSTTDFSVLA